MGCVRFKIHYYQVFVLENSSHVFENPLFTNTRCYSANKYISKDRLLICRPKHQYRFTDALSTSLHTTFVWLIIQIPGKQIISSYQMRDVLSVALPGLSIIFM